MRFISGCLAVVSLVAVPAYAQSGARSPDHWMTTDSLVAAVSVTEMQRAEFLKHYTMLNDALKKFADETAEIRRRMAGGPPTDQQMQTMRTRREETQTEVDAHLKAMRDLLTPEQQGKFDALAKPVMSRSGRRGGV